MPVSPGKTFLSSSTGQRPWLSIAPANTNDETMCVICAHIPCMLILKWNGRKKKNVLKKSDAKDSLGFAGFLLYRNFYHIPLVTKLHRSWKTLRSYIVQKWKAVLFSNMSEIRKTWRCTHLHQTLCISTRFDLTLLPSAHHWWSLLWRWPSTVRDLKSQHFRRSRGALRQKWMFSWAADVGWSGRTHHNLVFF